MAITESLPVGNEVAGGAASKAQAGVDAGVFAQSFAVAGKAVGRGTAAPGAAAKDTGLVVAAKGQQDLAGWGAGRGLEGQDGAAAGQTGSVDGAGQGSSAVSSLIGQHEVVELPGEDAPRVVLDQTGSGVGTKAAVWTPQADEVAGKTDLPGISGSADFGAEHGSLGSTDVLPSPVSARSVTGDQAVKVVAGLAPVPAKLTAEPVLQRGPLVEVAGGKSASVASLGVSRVKPVAVAASALVGAVAETIRHADAATGATSDLDASKAVVAAGAAKGATGQAEGATEAAEGTTEVAEDATGAAKGATGAGKTGAVESQPQVVASVKDGSALGEPFANAEANRQVGRDGAGAASASAPSAVAHGREMVHPRGVVAAPRTKTSVNGKALDGPGAGRGFAPGTLPVAGSTVEQGTNAAKVADVAALSVATPAAVRPASEARPLVFEEIGSEAAAGQAQRVDAAVPGGQVLADSAPAKVAGLQGLGPVAPVSAGLAIEGPVRAGSVSVKSTSGAAAGTAGRHANGSISKLISKSAAPVGSTPNAVVASSAGDGSSVLPVSVGAAVAPPLAAGASARPETEVGGVFGIASRGVDNAVGAKPGASGTAVVKERDRKTEVVGGRNEAATGTVQGVRLGAEAKVAAGVVQEAATASSTATSSSTGKVETAHGKSQDAGPAVSGLGAAGAVGAGAAGTVSGNAHGSAAGLSGGLTTAAASPAPVRAEVVSGTGGSSARPAGPAEDGGLGAGLSAGMSGGLAGSGQGHTTLQATPTVLEIGVPGGTHGWLKIRAEMGEGGAVQASVSSATQAGQETLRRELPAMSAYLQSEHVPVTLQMAHGVATIVGSAASGLGGGDGLPSGSGFGGGGQAGANAEQGRNDAGGFAGASASGADAGELGRERPQTSDTGVAGAVSGVSLPDGVSAAVVSVDTEWARPLGYGGVAVRGGGNWVNVIA